MSINDIYCVGDGFAHGHIWPEWPQIIQALFPKHHVEVISGIGSGNEFLIDGLLKHDISGQAVVFQWADPRRFDKLVEDQFWVDIGQADKIYHFNFYQRDDHLWWLSSASDNKDVIKYHDFYIQNKQANLRLKNLKKLLQGYLDNLGCRYVDISTNHQDLYSKETRFSSVRGTEIQPKPLVHFHYVIEVILPLLDIPYDTSRSARLEESIKKTEWVAYNPDREEIWKNIVKSLGPAE